MAHEFESGFFGGNVPAWHGLGTVIPEDVLTAVEAIELSGLGWDVELVPFYAEHGDGVVTSDEFRAVQRVTDGRILGVSSQLYKPVQNREAFAFADELVGSGDAKYHTAGALKGGRVTWMLARLHKDVLVGGMESERVRTFLLLANSFDRSRSLTAAITPIRVVCANTLQMALGGAARTWSARHREGIEGKIAEAREVLGISFRYMEEFERLANTLVTEKITTRSFEQLLGDLIPLEVEADTERSAKNRAEAREAIMGLFQNADNLGNVRGTKWAAYNAVAEYSDHHGRGRNTQNGTREEHRFARVTSDFGMKDRALALIEAV